MKTVTVLAGLVLLLAGIVVLLCPWLPLLAVALARWDATPSFGARDQHATIRGDVPRWLRWLQTSDERLPGGLYEPTVAGWLETRGRFWCSFMWIWWRNRAHGMRKLVDRPSTEAAWHEKFPIVDGRASGVRTDGTWYWSRDIGPLRVVAGYRIYALLDGTYSAVPTATIKKG